MRKLTDEQVEEIKKLLEAKEMLQATIAKKYGVSKTIISQISTGLYRAKDPKKKFKPVPRTTPPKPSVRKLTFADAQEIRRLFAKGEAKKKLSRQFGVSESTIKNIVEGHRYKE